ncbi:hypothetical protein SAMN05192538_2055 [Bacillus velezensis]|nr:hypothetical protein [Bacillus velezensis]AMQ71367.1 hypothetical protein BAMY6639_05925 [Bacillus amyloliquefaciens UMAF6639]GFR54342.1 hypothetical protein BAMY6639_05925 [Bacillus sp. CN2]ANF37812.1 hypothetical protein BCBMB205_29220 [Bacillus velezensis]ARZ59268.1 hypothetical protein BAGQ_3062 [Bacillus velezensis]MSD97562.1 hypothetical protein [Bacillus velezensis]
MIFLKKLLSYFQKGVILLNVADEQQTTTKSFGNNLKKVVDIKEAEW